MSVLIFRDEEKTYHYPPLDRQPDNEVTMCGRKAKKGDAAILAADVDTDMQPCSHCAEIQNHDLRFVGRVL